MNDEMRARTKNKRNLILSMMKAKFEDRVYDYLDKGEYQSIDEMDEWVDEQLRLFENETTAVREYYNDKMYS